MNQDDDDTHSLGENSISSTDSGVYMSPALDEAAKNRVVNQTVRWIRDSSYKSVTIRDSVYPKYGSGLKKKEKPTLQLASKGEPKAKLTLLAKQTHCRKHIEEWDSDNIQSIEKRSKYMFKNGRGQSMETFQTSHPKTPESQIRRDKPKKMPDTRKHNKYGRLYEKESRIPKPINVKSRYLKPRQKNIAIKASDVENHTVKDYNGSMTTFSAQSNHMQGIPDSNLRGKVFKESGFQPCFTFKLSTGDNEQGNNGKCNSSRNIFLNTVENSLVAKAVAKIEQTLLSDKSGSIPAWRIEVMKIKRRKKVNAVEIREKENTTRTSNSLTNVSHDSKEAITSSPTLTQESDADKESDDATQTTEEICEQIAAKDGIKTGTIMNNISFTEFSRTKSPSSSVTSDSVVPCTAVHNDDDLIDAPLDRHQIQLPNCLPEHCQKNKYRFVHRPSFASPETAVDEVSEDFVQKSDEICEQIKAFKSPKPVITVEPISFPRRYSSKSSNLSMTLERNVQSNPDDDKCTDATSHKGQLEQTNVPTASLQYEIHMTSLVTPDFSLIADAIKDNDLSHLENLVLKNFGSNNEMKSSFNILYIAAAVGTVECCQYLLNVGFTANASSMHPSVKDVLPDSKKQTATVSPLALSMSYTNLATIRLLLKHSSNDVLKSCSSMSLDIEAIVMKDLCRRLFEKYHSLKPRVVAGYEDDIPVLVVYSEALRSDTEIFCGKKVKFVNPKMMKREHSMSSEYHNEKSSQISEENMQIAKQVITERSKNLWNDHSNLNIISMSPTKRVREKLRSVPVCIALYCTSKRIIPLGEPKFPTFLWTLDGAHKIPVDVREGYFSFCPGYTTASSLDYHEKLKMGCSISRETNAINGGGTLGPFVDINGEDGFLTCAHVLFDIKRGPVRFEDDPPSAIGIVQPAKGTFSFREQLSETFQAAISTPCGYVKRAIFDPHRYVSIDAALVQITNPVRKPISGQFAIENRFGYTRVGFNDPPEYNSGSLKSPGEASVIRQVIKCGSRTHLTRGLLAANGIQVRPLDTCLGLPSMQTNYPMKNQMEIQSVEAHVPFLQPGDSGSAVFIVNEDRTLQCLGMAIGFTSYQTAVVTPINDILEALGPGVTLKAFSN